MLVGRTTTLRIVGYFTEWDETTTVRLTDADNNDVEGVEIETVLVSAVGLVANVTVADSVALGALKLHVFTGETSQVYMPEGASVTVTATATSSQSELQAGETFDILIENIGDGDLVIDDFRVHVEPDPQRRKLRRRAQRLDRSLQPVQIPRHRLHAPRHHAG